jgi:hypothetical protein
MALLGEQVSAEPNIVPEAPPPRRFGSLVNARRGPTSVLMQMRERNQ